MDGYENKRYFISVLTSFDLHREYTMFTMFQNLECIALLLIKTFEPLEFYWCSKSLTLHALPNYYMVFRVLAEKYRWLAETSNIFWKYMNKLTIKSVYAYTDHHYLTVNTHIPNQIKLWPTGDDNAHLPSYEKSREVLFLIKIILNTTSQYRRTNQKQDILNSSALQNTLQNNLIQ